MRVLLLALTLLAACAHRAPGPGATPSAGLPTASRCDAVAAVLRAHAAGGHPEDADAPVAAEPVQVFLRSPEGDVLERVFPEETDCELGDRYRVVPSAENEALTLVLTPAVDGFAWEVHRGVGPAVSGEPRPMGHLTREGGTWVAAETL